MRAFTNYNNVQEYTDSIKLPAGAYKAKIIRAEEQGDALCILFDIADGEYKDFYRKKFGNDKKAFPDDAKFKGVFRLWYPSGNEYDENNERKMKTALKKICESNSHLNIDFTKEWDGALLKDCCVGVVFREQEYNYKGNHGFTAQPFSLITLSDLKDGNFTIPEPKYLKGSTANPQQSNGFADMPLDEDDDLPF